MIPATLPRDDPRTTRMLRVDPDAGTFEDGVIGDLPGLLAPGDLLVVNDAATAPASLAGRSPTGAAVEVRLAGVRRDGSWRAVLFGDGDWRARTEDRAAPPRVAVGDSLEVGGVRARVAAVDERSPRLVALRFDGGDAAFWRALFRAGRPVQYSYLARPLALWDVQTPFAARPWAMEPPSAALPLTWDLVSAIRRRGVALAAVTHAAGLSSTGDEALDARLPFTEQYEVRESTVRAVETAKSRGSRVVAVGTTVVRAIEGAAEAGGGRLAAGRGATSLRLGPDVPRRVVDAVLTGVHEPGTSHFALLESFAPRALLDRAHASAQKRGYRGHEFGDAVLVLGSPSRAAGSEVAP